MSRAKENIKKLIQNHQLRLQKLKEEQALKGLDTPPQTLIEIEKIEIIIKELQQNLSILESEVVSGATAANCQKRKTVA